VRAPIVNGSMSICEEILNALETLSENDLEGVLEYIKFVQEFEVEDEHEAIARGKEEIAKGEVLCWRDIKRELDL
jgi:hypothetical protein